MNKNIIAMLSEPARFKARVRGRVQGVGFRYSVEQVADGLGLRGWVRNLPSGEVECVAEGPKEKLQELAAYLREGPPAARVEAVDLEWETPRGGLSGFSAG